MKNLLKKQTNIINSYICGTANGIFNDEFWAGQDIVAAALDACCEENGFEWHIECSKYDHNENGTPCRKTWMFSVTDGQRKSYGVIVAAGCGTVNNPLSRYDIVAYI